MIRAVGQRCAIDLDSFDLPLTRNEILERLLDAGFKIIDVDLPSLAESFIGQSSYKRGVSLSAAPAEFDCSGFVKWLFGRCGIWIPRRSPHQYAFARRIDDAEILAGDLAFRRGRVCVPTCFDVGHVGIVGTNATVIHACPEVGIESEPLATWQARTDWRGARRIVNPSNSIVSLELPLGLEIETSDDILWTLLETLKW
jgi:hypothetical protein